MRLRKTLFFAILVFCFCRVADADEPRGAWYPAEFHMSTTMSDGTLSLREIIDVAKSEGIRIIGITDRDYLKWEYGVWPARRILRKVVEMSSIFKVGFSRYLEAIGEEANNNRDIILLAGLETAPFYYWQGAPYSREFKICDWHKHLLVFGLWSEKDYQGLPTLANRAALRRSFLLSDIFRLWPIFLVFLGCVFFRKRECSYKDIRGCELGRYSKKWRLAGIVSIFLGVFFILNENPFVPVEFDQYCAQIGVKPYQKLINYVQDKGGLIYWAHPEARNLSQQQGVKIETSSHVDDVVKTRGYTGFSVFYEGYEELGRPGGAWDQLLNQYCLGKRSRPVWVMAGLGFDSGSKEDLGKLMRDVKAYVYLDHFAAQGVLQSMARGQVYVSRGGQGGEKDFLLEQFEVEDPLTLKSAMSGGTIQARSDAVIHVRGKRPSDLSKNLKITLIRGAEKIKEFDSLPAEGIAYRDIQSAGTGLTYYRLEIRCGDQLIVTNPIFVERKL